ncbi:MAG: hypothetical protein ACJAY5_000483 [Actinomycetes bacterium]
MPEIVQSVRVHAEPSRRAAPIALYEPGVGADLQMVTDSGPSQANGIGIFPARHDMLLCVPRQSVGP